MNYDGSLALVIETTEIRIRKFYEADENFALAESENDTRDDWRANYLAFFEEVVRMLDQLGVTLRVVSFLTANYLEFPADTSKGSIPDRPKPGGLSGGTS